MKQRKTEEEFPLRELAERAGVPARTIRLYITRGLLPGPLRAGRKAAYSQEHLERLREIKNLQRKGLTLAEIRRAVGGKDRQDSLPSPTAWLSYRVAPDVVVNVRGDADSWRIRRIQNAIQAMSAHLEDGDRKEQDNDDNS